MNIGTDQRKRIAMIVYNSVSHDARVLKEAETLQSTGYRVRVYGIQDDKVSTPFEVLECGVEVARVEWKYRLYGVFEGLAFAVAVIAALITYFVAHPIVGFIVDLGVVKSVSIVLALLVFAGVWRWAERIRRTALKLRRAALKPAKELPLDVLMKVYRQLQYLFKRFLVTREMESAVLRNLRQYDPHVVHCHDLPAVPAGYRYCKHRAAKCLYDSHEIYEEQSSFGLVTKMVFALIQRYYSGKVDAFITINDSIATFLTERYPKLPKPLIIRNATRMIEGGIQYDGRLHEAAGLDRTTRILLYQGGFARFRGLEALVQSAVLLPDGWCVVLMGWGNLEGRLTELAEQVDFEGERIRFLPGVSQAELVYWTAGATVGVIPYENVNLNNWYCTPNKLWEYPSAGVPLLVSPFPELRKAIEGYRMGWLIDEDLDPAKIATRVAALTDDELETARENCRRFVESDNWSLYATRLVDMYSQFLSEPR